ncbi:DUF4198 domain-containing protein [Acinetobacter sp. NIPH 2699]|uniref:DUF4198 domain-containing protein n=1 Tax=Acinetobacter sp. NIPH 2699 TaxID=2923433 RepID=UPI001F4A708C|nr:DUF4198 domain-containing protein [Acinetobacter sp. NIPH 2699]
MKKLLIASFVMISGYSFAHEPYVAPVAYQTTNTQVAIVAGYAEEALNSEYALKDAKFEITAPNQSKTTVEPDSKLGSTTVFDLKLPESGTYSVQTKASYPLKYVQDQKEWKLFFDLAEDKAPAKSERDYVISADLKGKKIAPVEVTREWALFTYITKEKSSPVQSTSAPIQVEFLTHPNELKANQAAKVKVSKANQPLSNAEVVVRAKGATEEQAKTLKANTDGTVDLVFPSTGEYLVEVSEVVDAKKKPTNQFYSIISLSVN